MVCAFMLFRAEILFSFYICSVTTNQKKTKASLRSCMKTCLCIQKIFSTYVGMSSSNWNKLFLIRPNTAYKNTVMRMSVPPEERLAVTLR
jgi:hypothetical protein